MGPTQLVHVIRQPRVADLNADFIEPRADVLQRVAYIEKCPDFRPGLADLTSLGARFFPRQRAETSEIQFVGGGVGHPTIIPSGFQTVYRKYPNSFGIFQFASSQQVEFRKVSEYFRKFQLG